MKKLSFLSCIVSIVLLTAAAAFAGDYADLDIIGFSADGRYLAFEESGMWDGSGGEYATTYYIDVDANKYALPPSVFEWEMDSMKESAKRPLMNRYKQKVAAALRRLRIVRGNTGQQVVAHLLNDWSHVEPTTRETYFYDEKGEQGYRETTDYAGGMINREPGTEKVIFNPTLDAYGQNTNEFYELVLTSSPARETENCSEGLRFEMTIKDNTHHRDLPVQVLQRDGDTVPESRQCPYGYRIEQVYYYKNRLAVFLNVFGQGFEGPDMRYMAVTGLLEYEANPPN